MNIKNALFELQDLKYRDFHARLLPGSDKNKIIGVRVPNVRALAKEFYKKPEHILFLNSLPHEYFEENNLHAFLIEKIKDYDEVISRTDEFLPYVDNWATCDSFSPPAFKKNKDRLLKKIPEWIASDRTYTKRFGIEMLMSHFLDDDFREECMNMVSNVHSEEYYVNMMIAWYFATALDKQYKSAIEYIKENRLDKWTHNKAIQKAVESHRIDKETKEYLKSLKR